MPAPSVQISACALTLRPVAARVVSYGRSNKMAQRATLYVLRVSRGGREWFVARRFSEFRALDAALRLAMASRHGGATRERVCAQCRELARRVAAVAFPSRFPIRSSFASSREKIESARLQQLDAFVQLLMETTQGLLANQDDEYDDDDDDEEEETDYDGCVATDDGEREDRCDALRIIREFLLVHDHLLDDKKPPPTTTTTNQQQLAQPSTTTTTTTDGQHRATATVATTTPALPPQRRPRLTSSSSLGSSTTTFRVQELDAMYRPASPLSPWMSLSSHDLHALATTAKTTSASPNVLNDDELDALFLADYASPAVDAVIHRQLEVADMPVTHVLRRTESMRTNRWGL